jgi:hypothetical protein
MKENLMRFVKQKDSWSCFACVAAMATNKTLKYVIKEVGYDGSEIIKSSKHPKGYKGFELPDMFIYFAKHNFLLGSYFHLKENLTSKDEEFIITVSVNTPAMIVVKSGSFVGAKHCIYYDGETIYDPRKKKNSNPKFEDYEIEEWWPIVKIID